VARALQFGSGVRQRGFTLIEILVAVALIGILATVAVLAFGKQARKTRGSEVNAMFAALRVSQEQYHLENGTYYSTGTNEGDIWPTTPTKTSQTFLPMPATWVTTRVDLPNDRGYCGYVVRAGRGGDGTNIGAKAVEFGFTTAPVTDWYYLLAKCDLNGSATRDSYYFTWSGDTRVQKQNEGY
jgi:prepilin-type N-terminal cleavage/methylation domain-containing protein